MTPDHKVLLQQALELIFSVNARLNDHVAECDSVSADQVRAIVNDRLKPAASALIQICMSIDEPDWNHPKIKNLAEKCQRRDAEIAMAWHLLTDPNWEPSDADNRYWGSLHESLKATLLKVSGDSEFHALEQPDNN